SLLSLFFERYPAHRDLHSFPTRRSSDLVDRPCDRQPRTGGPESAYGRSDESRKGTRVLDTDSLRGLSLCSTLSNFGGWPRAVGRSEEHTSELQSLTNLVCRLLL